MDLIYYARIKKAIKPLQIQKNNKNNILYTRARTTKLEYLSLLFNPSSVVLVRNTVIIHPWVRIMFLSMSLLHNLLHVYMLLSSCWGSNKWFTICLSTICSRTNLLLHPFLIKSFNRFQDGDSLIIRSFLWVIRLLTHLERDKLKGKRSERSIHEDWNYCS